jgi:hypothetical protein
VRYIVTPESLTIVKNNVGEFTVSINSSQYRWLCSTELWDYGTWCLTLAYSDPFHPREISPCFFHAIRGVIRELEVDLPSWLVLE